MVGKYRKIKRTNCTVGFNIYSKYPFIQPLFTVHTKHNLFFNATDYITHTVTFFYLQYPSLFSFQLNIFVTFSVWFIKNIHFNF